MPVRFQPFASGGDVFASSFSDTFNRANATTLGTDWLYLTCRLNIVDAYAIPFINGATCQWTQVGGTPGVMNPGVAIPRSLIGSSLIYGRSQFAQATFNSFIGTCDSGVSVFTRRDGTALGEQTAQGMYTWGQASAVVSVVRRISGLTGTNLFVGACAAGDVFRLEVVAGSGGSNTVTAYLNGVVQFTGTDTNVVQQSVPGVQCANVAAGGGATWTNFSCGIL